jgi:hypothetical protein
MKSDIRNRLMIAGLVSLLVAGCSSQSEIETPEASPPEDEAPGQLSPESLAMAETAWLSVGEDGSVYTTYLDPDGKYRDTSNGEVVYAGEWDQNTQGQLCFNPDKGEGVCWAHKSPGLNGVMRAKHPDGHAIELKRIAYVPPEEPSETAEESSEPGAGEG